MHLVTAAQMRAVENDFLRATGLPSIVLMENAAVRAAAHVLRLTRADARIVVLCGPGNNGGDGLAVARQLFAQGREVSVALIADPARLTGDALANYTACAALAVPFLPALPPRVDFVVDALFGIGLTRAPEGAYAEAIRAVNRSGADVLAVDIPSGFCADTGQALGETVHARYTVTFGYTKRGLLLYPCAANAGTVWLESIGIGAWDAGEPRVSVYDDADIKRLLPPRRPDANKGSHGRVFVVAGSADMPGAAVLACAAAYRVGAGLVAACVPPEAARVIHSRLPEAITCDRTRLDMTGAKAVLLGPGLGADAADLLRRVLRDITCPLVLDADGLNALADDGLAALAVPCVITPHPGEMRRLTGLSIPDILRDPVRTAMDFARAHNVHVLLKGPRTVIASPSPAPDAWAVVNPTGSAALAKAGTGDVLAGVVAGLIAQGLDVGTAAAVGAYIHGKAGERLPLHGALAGEVADALPGVIAKLV